jgi:hypothetical protein
MPTLTERNVLFDPSPKQMEFLDAVFSNKYRVILFGGAIRGGKTYAGLGALLLLCKVFPNSVWAVVRDSLPTLKRNTIPAFLKICPRIFIKSYNQEQQLVTFKNGSKILFFPENYDDDKELNRWKGLEVSGFLLEEVNELQEVSFFKAIERSGSYIPPSGIKKPKPLIMMTCNPASNWVKRLIYDKYMGYPDEHGKAQQLPDSWLYIPSKMTDNPYVMSDLDYVESLKSLPQYQYKVFVEGDWDTQLKVGGEYFKCFELDKHVVKNEFTADGVNGLYDPNLPLHISWDDNVNPYLPCGIFQIHKTPVMDGEKTIYDIEVKMIDEIAGKTPLNTVEKVCQEIERKFPGHTAGMYIYGDATAMKEDTKLEKGHNFYTLVLGYLKKYLPQSKVMSNNPNVVPRGQWINSVFEKNVGRIKIIIGNNCKTCINDFILLKEDENGAKAKIKKKDPNTQVSAQIVGHFADLFEYFMVSAFASHFADWQSGGAVASIRFGKNAKSKNSYK